MIQMLEIDAKSFASIQIVNVHYILLNIYIYFVSHVSFENMRFSKPIDAVHGMSVGLGDHALLSKFKLFCLNSLLQ